MFINCQKCGKRLIERMPNGLFRFRFGSSRGENKRPVVEIVIHGSVKIKCLRRGCNHQNVLNYFPEKGIAEDIKL